MLADHDIRPTAEVALYGGNDPRLRGRPASFITTSRRNSNYNREPAHSLMRFIKYFFLTRVLRLKTSQPASGPSQTWPTTTSTRGLTPPSSPPAFKTSSSPGIFKIFHTRMMAPTIQMSSMNSPRTLKKILVNWQRNQASLPSVPARVSPLLTPQSPPPA